MHLVIWKLPTAELPLFALTEPIMIKDTTRGIIISLGSVNADFQVKVEQSPGKTTTMLAHDFRRFSGGKAANVAYIAAKLGRPAAVIARVGDDDLSRQALGALREMEIDLKAVEKVNGAPTGFSMIMVPADGKKNIVLATNANDAWEEKDREKVRRAISAAPAGSVLVVDYEVPPFIVEEAILTASEMDFPVVLDPSPTERVDQALFSKIAYIVPDASETEGLTGIIPDSVEKAMQAVRELQQAGIRKAIVKLEDGGCVLGDGDQITHVPSGRVDVVDTTGAGDAFAGALAVAILESRSFRDAACLAVAAAQAAVTTYGSQPAYPTRERLEELFNQIRINVKEVHEH